MQILLVTHFYPEHAGGIEIIAGEVAKELCRRGLRIDWAAGGADAAGDESRLKRVPMKAWNLSEDRWGIPYPVWSPWSLRDLVSAVQRCDLVHIHDCLYMGNVVAFFAAKFLKKPIVVTQHIGHVPYRNWVPRVLHAWCNRILGAMVLSRCEGCVFYGGRVREYFEQFVNFRRPPAFISNGVDHSLFRSVTVEERNRLRTEVGLRLSRPLALFVGRFVEKKGLRHIRRLATLFPFCEWVLFGWGPEAPHLWGLPNVRCLGKATQRELIPYYQVADLLVLPSVGEGLPLVVQEAMACGLTAMVSKETALALAGLDAVTIPVDVESDDLVDKFRAAIDQPERLRERSVEIANFARRHWNWNQCADSYFSLFSELIEKGPNRRSWDQSSR